MTSFQIYVKRDFLRRGFKLVAFKREGDRLLVTHRMEFMDYPAGEAPSSDEVPGIEIDEAAAQSLIDSLWEVGLRPTEGMGSAGSFTAQGRHLEDMRALVFKAIEMEKPR